MTQTNGDGADEETDHWGAVSPETAADDRNRDGSAGSDWDPADSTDDSPDAAGKTVQDEVVTAEIVDGSFPDPMLNLPDDPSEAVEMLKGALATSQNEAAGYLDDYRRMTADFDNFRKRTRRDQADLAARATERLVVSLLPVLDSFDAALAVEADGESAAKMLAGMRGTRDQLLAQLKAEGLELIETVGAPFDPALHEAAQMAAGSGTMVVTAELRRGYSFNGRVLRAALVAVGYDEQD